MEPAASATTPKSAWAGVVAIVCGAELIVVATIGGAGLGALLDARIAMAAAAAGLVAVWLARRSISGRRGRR